MPVQTHAPTAAALSLQCNSPTPLHFHLQAQSPAQAHSSIKHLTGEVLATAHQLQQQIRTLECLAHATEEREATLVQQRAKLQELLRLVTQMETAEVRATASLRDTLARVRAGRDRGAAALAALRLAGASVSASASPGASPRPRQGLGQEESSGVGSPAPLGGSGTESGGGGGGGGGEGDADPVDNPRPESASARHGARAEEHEANGGGRQGSQPGEGEGPDGASTQGGASSKHGESEDPTQPLPQFTSLRVKIEDEESGGAPQEVVGAPLPQADAVAAPGASETGVVDRDHDVEDERTRTETEHGAGEVKQVEEVQAAGVGRGEACRPLDRGPMSAPGGTSETKGSPVSSRQGNEPTDAAVGSDGSWRARKRMPGRNAKEQMRGGKHSGVPTKDNAGCADAPTTASAEPGSRQEGPKTKGAKGDSDGQAGGHQKRGGQRTPSPKKDQVPGDRVLPSPPKKAGESSPIPPSQGFRNVCGVLTNCLPSKVKAKGERCAGTELSGLKRVR